MSTTLVGKYTDLLLFLLYYAEAIHCTELYFCSDKVNQMSTISRSIRRYLEKQPVVIYCSFMRSPDTIQRPDYLG